MADVSSHTSTVLNKILIPVITTVLGATAIYFLGFNKKGGRSDMEQLLLTKEATVKGWKTFVTSQNIGYKNVQSISEDYTEKIKKTAPNGFEALVPVLKDFQKDLLRETNKAKLDMEELLKEPDLDKGFVSMLNRSLDNQAEDEKQVTSFFNNLYSLARSNLSDEEKATKWEEETAEFVETNEKASKRAATEAEDIAKDLSERYGQTFDLNDLLVYVDYKKELERRKKENTNDENDKEEKKQDIKIDNPPAPVDPANQQGRGGTEYVNDDGRSNNTNTITYQNEITAASLLGTWSMNGGSLSLYSDMSLYWTITKQGYTTGTWSLSNNQIRINAKNPDTQKLFLMIFNVALSGNSLVLTNASNPTEVYRFTR